MTNNQNLKLSICNIGRNIRHYRRLSGLSAADVAASAFLGRDYYTRLEEGTGDTLPEAEALRRIGIILNVPVKNLLLGTNLKLEKTDK